MKKLLVVLGVAFVLLLACVLVFSLFIEKALVAGVETVGPELTGTNVHLSSVDLSMRSGRLEISGLEVGNPDGFESEYSIRLGTVVLDIVPASLIQDKIVIEEVRIDSPEMILEIGSGGANISRILKNVEKASGATEELEEDDDSSKRFEIRKLTISNGKMTLANKQLNEEGIVLPLADIIITDIGTDEQGATIANVIKRVLLSINKETLASSTKNGKFIGKQLESTADNLKESIGGFLKGFKKKEEPEGD